MIVIVNPPIQSLIFMFNHYRELAISCWTVYPDICDAYICYDHYMIYVQHYERLILEQLT